MSGVFFDTNLWVYIFSGGDMGLIAIDLLGKHFPNISVSSQILGELYNVLTKKSVKTPDEAMAIISRMVSEYEILPLGQGDVIRAVGIATRYKLSYWDSLVIASALEAGCEVLYTEDLQHGQVFEKTLKVVNPFLSRKT